MRVGDLLGGGRGAVVTVESTADIPRVVRLLIRHNVGALAVIDGAGRLVGIVSERDVVAAVERHGGDATQLAVAQVMRTPPTCAPGDTLHSIMTRMTRERLRHLVVVDADRVAGIVSVGDIVKRSLDELETETSVLRDVVAAQRAV